jgi:transposase
VLRSGIPWELLPQEMGCGSGVTCWRRLREWQQAGVWTRFHGTLLDRLGRADRLDWSRANLDSRLVAAKRGPSHRPEPDGSRAARLETARAQRPPGHPTGLSAANCADSLTLAPMLDTVPPIKRPLGRPRQRPDKLDTDKGYDARHCREACRRRGITPRIARRGIESKEQLGRHRWVAERTFAWLSRFRRLRVRDDRQAASHLAFLQLGCALLCLNFWHHRF